MELSERGKPKRPPLQRQRRVDKFDSYADLAREVGVSRGYISRVYMGYVPSVTVLVKMAKALGLSVDKVLKSIPTDGPWSKGNPNSKANHNGK